LLNNGDACLTLSIEESNYALCIDTRLSGDVPLYASKIFYMNDEK